MEQYKRWETCMKMIEAGKVKEAEEYGIKSAKELGVNQSLLNKIIAVNLKPYEKRIDAQMNECIEKARAENAKALCLYYSMDNGWDSTMYICKDYHPENSRWIGASRSWVDIGKARGFSAIYKKDAEAAFFADDLSSGIVLLLMLRTTLAFYNVTAKYKNCGLKLCITATESDFVTVA